MRGPPPREAGSCVWGGVGAPDSERARPREHPPSPRGCQDSERARSLRTPRGCPGLGEGASDSTSWTPCSRGQAHDPPALALPLFPERGHPVLHKPARPGRPFVHTAAVGGSEGAQPQTLAFLLLFFFFLLLEERRNRVFDSALFMFLLGNKRWLCVCVFSCVGFLKKWEEEKKKTPFPFLALAPPLPSFLHPSSRPFCSVVFVLLRVHIPVCNPWFARFSVFSKVSLRQLGSLPPSSPAGA